jgi:hypothetical protein
MGSKITWDEMKNSYPEEWLLIVDYDLDESGRLLRGVVERHSKRKENVYSAPAIDKPAAFRFTGESAFSGLRSHGGY